MLQFSFGTDGIKLRSYIIGCADCLESFLLSQLGLDDRRQRKYTCAGFSKRSQQRVIFKLPQNDWSDSLGIEPEIKISSECSIVGWQ